MEEVIKENEQLRKFMNDAIGMLEDHKDKLGMFQAQRYLRLKAEIEKFNRLSVRLRSSLLTIVTSD